jgi:hypothetical protein
MMLIAGALLMLAANAAAQEKVPAPVYKEGDVWIFNVAPKKPTENTRQLVGNYKVAYRGGKFVIVFPGGEKPQIKLDLSQLRSMLDEPNDKKHFLQFPLYVGEEWNTAYEAASAGSLLPIARKAETKVSGTEEVATPAGMFRAFKIERFETGIKNQKRGGNEQTTYTYYYSPEVRAIVKFSYEHRGGTGRSIELVKFVPAK